MLKQRVFSQKFARSSNFIYLSKFVSSFGSAFSKFAVPLYVYGQTNEVAHIGMQWAVVAIVQLIACLTIPHIQLVKNDRKGVFITDILMATVLLLPLIFHNIFPVAIAYVVTVLITYLGTLQASYFESLIGHIYDEETEKEKARGYLLGKCKTGENMGFLVGFAMAGVSYQAFGFKASFVIDAVTFLLSALSILFVESVGYAGMKKLPAKTLSLVFGPKLHLLSISQAFAAFSVFVMNGIYLVVLKDVYGVTDHFLGVIFTFQFASSLFGSYLFTRLSLKIPNLDTLAFLSRLSYFPMFLLFGFLASGGQFLVLYSLFCFVVAFSLPAIQSMFQREVEIKQLRGVGVGRLAINSIAGGMGACFGAVYLSELGFRNLYLISAFAALIGACFFFLHLKKRAPKGLLARN